MCRPSRSVCDVPEYCLSTSTVCPPDVVVEAGFECRRSAGVCDSRELCDGRSALCPPDVYFDGVVCRENEGAQCDVVEKCNGTSPLCPPDVLVTAGTPCYGRGVRPGAGGPGACLRTSECDGTSPFCATAERRPAGAVCDDGDACFVGRQCDPFGGCIGGTFVCDCRVNSDCAAATPCRELGQCVNGRCQDGAPRIGRTCPLDAAIGVDIAQRCASINSTVPLGLCDGLGLCRAPVCGNPLDGVDCSGHGACCGDGVCHCSGGYAGPDCELALPGTPGPTVRWVDPSDANIVDECPTNPHKLKPGLCGCDIGDEDGDGVEDCLEEFFTIETFDWARNLDVYEILTDSPGHVGRLVARIGLPPKSLSDTPLQSAVTLTVRFTFDNYTQLYDDNTPQPALLYSTAVAMHAVGGPFKSAFEPKLQLCLRRLRSDLQYDLLCLAERREQVGINSTQISWECVDESLSEYVTSNDVSLICGEIDHFGNYTVVVTAEVGLLRRIVHDIVHSAGDALGLSEVATAFIILSALACVLILCIAACCWVLRRRAKLRDRADGYDKPLTGVTSTSGNPDALADDSSDEVEAFAALHGLPPDDAFEEADANNIELDVVENGASESSALDRDASESDSRRSASGKKKRRHKSSSSAMATLKGLRNKKA
jgi:hypothetical protein